MERGPQLASRVRRRWSVIELLASTLGAFVVLGFLHAVHSASERNHPAGAALTGSLELLAYLAVALPVGWVWRERRTKALWRWLYEERAPDASERELVLREPLRELVVPAALWGGAALLFGALETFQALTSHGALATMLTIVLGGLTTCALIYLEVERLLRPVTARALDAVVPDQPAGPGVRARLVMAWVLASGLPLLGLALVAVGGLSHHFKDVESLAGVVLILVSVGLVAGALATVLSARSLAERITAVRNGLDRIRAGDLNVRLPVDDGNEVGLLQAGFNEMARGLRERERLRDLFGRHVGEGVARRALEDGVSLGGELREIAALFVDLVGSTALAARRPPEEVVELVNRLFGVVVDVADKHGGWVNKFEGDGALCVFGAPVAQANAAGSALAAGRELAERLRENFPDLHTGVGISAGPAIAGNVGAERRLEYTVMGDPVNEAARLCELAKARGVPVLVSAEAVTRAQAEEAAHWLIVGEAILRGRPRPTRLAVPRSGESQGVASGAPLGARNGPAGFSMRVSGPARGGA